MRFAGPARQAAGACSPRPRAGNPAPWRDSLSSCIIIHNQHFSDPASTVLVS